MPLRHNVEQLYYWSLWSNLGCFNLWKIMSYVHSITLEKKPQNFTEFPSPLFPQFVNFFILFSDRNQSIRYHFHQGIQSNSAYFILIIFNYRKHSLFFVLFFYFFKKWIPWSSWTRQQINSTIRYRIFFFFNFIIMLFELNEE